MKKVNKPAFTLAEVIVTIGVIGIIAAMTLPSVINKMEDKHNIAMWKKKYSQISNIYYLVKQEIETSICVNTKEGNFDILEKCSTIKTPYAGTYTTLSPEFVRLFVSHLSVVESCSPYEAYGNTRHCSNYYRRWLGLCAKGSSFYAALGNKTPGKQVSFAACKGSLTGTAGNLQANDFNRYAALLDDGSVIYFGGHHTGWITVDVNGAAKGPNKLGKDIFTAMVNDEWIKPLGAPDTFDTTVNGSECECSQDYGVNNDIQGFLGSGDLLHGRMASGGCCSASYLYAK